MASFSGTILVIVSVFGITLILVQKMRQWLRLRHIPGPPGAGISAWWHLKHSMAGRMHLDTAEACEKYGPLVRIAPNELAISDSETIKRITNVRTLYRRSDWYKGLQLHPEHDNVLSVLDSETHLELRAKMAAGYSGKENEHLEQSIDVTIAKFIYLLKQKYLSAGSIYRPVDFAEKVQFLTLDVITDIAFGQAFGYLEQDKDLYAFIEKTKESLPAMIFLGVFPWLNGILHSPLFRSMIPSDKDPAGLGKLMSVTRKIVAVRFGPDKKDEPDMLGSFIRHGLTQTEAESNTLMQILAGSDTTATATRATLLHILTAPHVLQNLLNEITTYSPSHPITDAEARQMPYLQAVIKEGLRIFPPVTGMFYKTVPAGGDTVCGYFVPEGTKIGWSSWGMMRDPKVWGADAKVFRPERWLDGTVQEMNADMVFGWGRFQCLGKSIAYIELNKIFIELLRNFELTLVNPEEPWKSMNAGLFLQSNMWMRISKREAPL